MKRILLILPLIVMVLQVSAQRFNEGIIAGLSISDVDGFNNQYPDFKHPGFTVGGFVNTKIGQMTKLQLEISFIEKGSQLLPDSTNNNPYYDLTLNYIDVSLMVRQPVHWKVNNKLSDKYGLIFGLTYGTLAYYQYTAQSIVYSSSTYNNGLFNNHLDGELNTFDASAFIGFYYNFSPQFFADVRYSNSFIPAVKHNSTTTFYPYFNSWNSGSNLCFELRLGYQFGSGKNNASGQGTASPPEPPSN
ncbi:MAG: outer membrane beta-barrel protein [Bacteroidia bacterium]